MAGVSKSSRGVIAPLSLVVMCVVFFIQAPTPSHTLNLSSIIGTVIGTAADQLYKKEEILLFDHYCTLTRQPYIKRWELHYKSEVYCPGWTSIIGKVDTHRNPTKSDRAATQHFVTQALARDLVTQDQADIWLTK